MSWMDLNQQNITEIKILYSQYVAKNIGNVNRLSFEEFIGDIEQCSMCGCYELRDNLIDTEGMANGGFGLVCESCRGDM